MTQFYQALLRDGGPRLGPRLRRCFAAWAGVEDDGDPNLEHAKGRTRTAFADNELCGRYTHDGPTGDGRLRTTATWAAGRGASPGWVRVTVEGDSLRNVAAFVSQKLAVVDGVRSTNTHFLLKTYKDGGEILVEDPAADDRLPVAP